MKRFFLFLSGGLLLLLAGFRAVSGNESSVLSATNTATDSAMISRIYTAALTQGQAYEHLRDLCAKHPKRLSGSAGAAQAVVFCQQLLLTMQLDSVWLQPCMVPRWERGTIESGTIVQKSGRTSVRLCALGSSSPTPAAGITAEVVEVHSFDELAKLGAAGVKGKIVFFNHPFRDEFVSPFDAYSEAAGYRTRGPAKAQQLGAAAVLVRSMTHAHDAHPHTGNTRFDSLQPLLPCAALSTNDAEVLSKKLSADSGLKFTLKLNCRLLPDVLSYNVIGEIRGTELPNDVIVFGGHLDAWDLGEGAHDDGAGCMHAIEVLRLFKQLNYRPRRTVRAVLWMNEENGLRGATAYADWALRSGEKHIAAIESDAGGFSPRGFGLTGSATQLNRFLSWQPLLAPYLIGDWHEGGGGADIGPLDTLGTALISLEPDQQRYFDYHHTEIDVFSAVNRRELLLGAAGMASLVFLIDRHGI